MKRITALKIIQIVIMIVIGVLLAFIHHEWSFRNYILQMLVIACSMVFVYIDIMIDEEKEE